jgi:hypothetical protein
MNPHLSEDQISQWIAGERSREAERHLSDCPECAAEVVSTQKSLLLFKNAVHLQAVSLPTKPVRGRRTFRVACLAAAAAALLTVGVFRYSRQPQVSPRQEMFLEIPYSVPPAPYERTAIVRMEVPVAALIAAGFRMEAPAADSVSADVVVGQDGRPLAVGFPKDEDKER